MKLIYRILIVTALGLVIIFEAKAQDPANTDSVCAGQTGITYEVDNHAGSTYLWVVTGGVQSSGGTTNAITVDWGAAPGLQSLTVVETNISGCAGDMVSLPVRVLPLPTALMAGTTAVCTNGSASLSVALTGVGPWTVTYTDGTSNTTVTTSTSPLSIDLTGLTATKTYSLVSVSGRKSCGGTVGGSATVTVNSKPVTSIITRQ